MRVLLSLVAVCLFGNTNAFAQVELEIFKSVGIRFQAETGVRYQLFMTTDPSASEWTPSGEPIIGEGTAFTFHRPSSVPDNALFKVEVLDAPAIPGEDEYAISDLGMILVRIPAGTFEMGSPNSEKDRDGDEGPETPVTISRDFWLGKHEVTIGEFRQFLLAGGSTAGIDFSNGPIRRNATFDIRGNLFGLLATQPMNEVSRLAAKNFCQWLTERERMSGILPDGYEYSLPTEAQWEYACRAGTTTRFYYGDDLDYSAIDEHGWFSANSKARTHPVGEKQANPWGLFDMLGNVSEWCND